MKATKLNRKSAAKRTAGSLKRRVMPRKRAWLSERTIEKISDRLHESIQFYNEYGQSDNYGVLKAVEECLKKEA